MFEVKRTHMKVAAAVVKKKKASFIKIKLRSTKQKAGNHTGTENKRHNPAQYREKDQLWVKEKHKDVMNN